ncbi:MAG: glycosyltransferase family 9 protein [Fibrobacterota bacterium]
MIFSWVLRKKLKNKTIEIPSGLRKCSYVLIILPQNRLEMVFQLENLIALLSLYKHAEITLLCTPGVSSFVRGLHGVRIQEYPPEEMCLYSLQWKTFIQESEGVFDLCINLEKQENLALLYLIGHCRIPIRVGYEEAGDYPFLNIRLKNSSQENRNLSERNRVISKFLGAKGNKNIEWGVSKTTADETKQLLREMKLAETSFLTGVDLCSLEAYCGKGWCEHLIRSLKKNTNGQFYIFSGMKGETNAIPSSETFPLLPQLSIPQTAALIKQTHLIITSKSALLGLAQLSSCHVAAVLKEKDFSIYCKNSPSVEPFTFTEKPSGETSDRIIQHLKNLNSQTEKKKVMSHQKR